MYAYLRTSCSVPYIQTMYGTFKGRIITTPMLNIKLVMQIKVNFTSPVAKALKLKNINLETPIGISAHPVLAHI